jgi:integrase
MWKQTLKTCDQRAAEAKVRAIAVTHDQLIERARRATAAGRLKGLLARIEALVAEIKTADARGDGKAVRPLQREYLKLSDQYGHAIREAIIEGYAAVQRAPMDVLTSDERSTIERGGLGDFYLDALDDVHAADVHSMLARLGYSFSEDETDYAELLTKKAIRRRRTLGKLGAEPFGVPDDPNNPRLSVACEKWHEERGQDAGTQRRNKVAVRRFVEWFGDLRVREITRQHIKDYIAALASLADQRRVPVSQRGGIADPGKDVPRITAATVGGYLTKIKALLTFCKGEGWVTTNVADGLQPPKDTRPYAERKRRSFTTDERRILLAQAIKEGGIDGDPAWLIRIAAYSGSRLELCCQLRRKDVRMIDGIMCVEFTDAGGRPGAKTPASVRIVPLHPEIAEGFYAWARNGDGDERVFTSFKADKGGRFANKVSNAMGTLMDHCGLTDKTLVHHSWRHTLTDAMRDALVHDSVAHAIVGHQEKGVHAKYGSGVSLKTMANELAKVPPLF